VEAAAEAEATLVAVNQLGGDGETGEEEAETETAPNDSAAGPGVGEQLRKVDLYERMRQPEGDGPQSRTAPEATPELRELALAFAETAAALPPCFSAVTQRVLVGSPASLPTGPDAPPSATLPPGGPEAPGEVPARLELFAEIFRDLDAPGTGAAGAQPADTPGAPGGEGGRRGSGPVSEAGTLPPQRVDPAEAPWVAALAAAVLVRQSEANEGEDEGRRRQASGLK
jgi:hypothetical protein